MNLERAIEIAVSAHKGAVDKGGQPYILHPLAVMMSLKTDAEKIVGVLHDVVEDTDWTFEALKQEGFSEDIIEALQSVTKSDKAPRLSDFLPLLSRVGRIELVIQPLSSASSNTRFNAELWVFSVLWVTAAT